MVTKNLKQHIKMYMDWEKYLKTCDPRTSAINKIIERF